MSLESIRDRVEAATPERWHAEEIVGEYHVMVGYPFGDTIGVFNEEGDAELAAYARTDIPLLLKVAEAAKRELMWKRETCFAFPERKHRACSTCGHADVCTALAELEAGE